MERSTVTCKKCQKALYWDDEWEVWATQDKADTAECGDAVHWIDPDEIVTVPA